jgi:hypothetical protein
MVPIATVRQLARRSTVLRPVPSRIVTAFLCCALLPSCGPRGVKLYPVRGQVFFQDKPAEGATVVFQLANASDLNALKPSGVAGADGSFTLSTFAPGDGAPAGDYIVVITWFPKDAKSDPATGEVKNRLPDVYGSRATSTLRAKVNEGPNEFQPFKLTKR